MSEISSILRDYNRSRKPEARSAVCHAPSVSLNFEQSGVVTACCYNRRFILGRYPKQSLKEIWSGERVKELREFLRRGDLSHGCQLCESQLRAHNYQGLMARKFDEPFDGEDIALPRVIEFETSNVCNLECVMCNGYFSSAIRRNREKLEPLPHIYDDAFVQQLREFIPALKQAKFLGGEPFLNPIFYKIWDAIIELNPAVHVDITTNATIMNDKVLKVLERLQPAIVVSCDSFDKATYEAIRVNADFDQVRANIDTFIAKAPPQRPLTITVCPMTINWKTLPDMARWAQQNKICMGFNTVVWPPRYSIKNLLRHEIESIHSFLLAGAPPVAQAGDHYATRYNHESYRGMINQISLWAETNSAVAQ